MPNSFKLVKPLPTAVATSALIRKRIKVNLTPLAKKHAFYRQVLVAGWQPQHTPKFRGVVTVGRDTVSLDIFIVNGNKLLNDYSSATIEDLWTWWEKTGTKAHTIKPVRATFLRYMMNGEAMYSLIVNHPGTTPKRKTPALNRQLSGQMNPLLQKSMQEGIRNAK